MDLERTKQLAGLSEGLSTPGQGIAPSVGNRHVDEMLAKLEQIKGPVPHMSQLDMIYQWVKTGHANNKQFRQLINWWSRAPDHDVSDMPEPPREMF